MVNNTDYLHYQTVQKHIMLKHTHSFMYRNSQNVATITYNVCVLMVLISPLFQKLRWGEYLYDQ